MGTCKLHLHQSSQGSLALVTQILSFLCLIIDKAIKMLIKLKKNLVVVSDMKKILGRIYRISRAKGGNMIP